jgi:RimJ/RimL family protein N-acetyltransferase
MNEADAEAVYFGYASSKDATRFMDWPRHTQLEQSVAFVAYCAQAWKIGSAFPWAVLKHSTGEFIGCLELRLAPPKADFGYIYCERFWRQGFGAEAAAAVVDWAFAQPEIFRVWAACSPDNFGSARVLEKAGLTLEARLENWSPRPQLGLLASPSLVFAKTKTVPAPS